MKCMTWIVLGLLCLGCRGAPLERLDDQQVVVAMPPAPDHNMFDNKPLDVTETRISDY